MVWAHIHLNVRPAHWFGRLVKCVFYLVGAVAVLTATAVLGWGYLSALLVPLPVNLFARTALLLLGGIAFALPIFAWTAYADGDFGDSFHTKWNLFWTNLALLLPLAVARTGFAEFRFYALAVCAAMLLGIVLARWVWSKSFLWAQSYVDWRRQLDKQRGTLKRVA